MKMTPSKLRFLLNYYFGPYIGAGVKIEEYSPDWRFARVSMKLRWYNRNAVNTHFGGSMYSMTDPHYMLMLMNILGKDYTVWDKHAEIDFIKPGEGKLTAEFVITDEMLQDIKDNTESGEKYLPEYLVEVKNAANEVVCEIKRTLYIKRRRNKKARF